MSKFDDVINQNTQLNEGKSANNFIERNKDRVGMAPLTRDGKEIKNNVMISNDSYIDTSSKGTYVLNQFDDMNSDFVRVYLSKSDIDNILKAIK